MKKVIMGLAMAALLASPALAQSYSASTGSGNLVGPPNFEYSGPIGPGDRSDTAAGKAANRAAAEHANATGTYGNGAFGAYAYEPGQNPSIRHGWRQY